MCLVVILWVMVVVRWNRNFSMVSEVLICVIMKCCGVVVVLDGRDEVVVFVLVVLMSMDFFMVCVLVVVCEWCVRLKV